MIKGWLVLSLVVLTGCASTPRRPEMAGAALEPAAAARYPNQIEKLEKGRVYLRSGDFQLAAMAQPVAKRLAMQLQFTNHSQRAVKLEAGQITLSDANGTLLRPITAQEISAEYQRRATELDQQAKKKRQEEQEADKAREQRLKDPKTGEADRSWDATQNILAGLTGSESQALAKEADSAREEARRVKSIVQQTPFFAAEVPPEQSLNGTVYFEMPSAWPVTLTVRADADYLAAQFSPPTLPLQTQK